MINNESQNVAMVRYKNSLVNGIPRLGRDIKTANTYIIKPNKPTRKLITKPFRVERKELKKSAVNKCSV